MAKALIIAFILVTLLIEYSLGGREQKIRWLEKRQFVAANGAAASRIVLPNVKNPMRIPHPLGPAAGFNGMKIQGKGMEKNKERLQTKKNETLGRPGTQNDKNVKTAKVTRQEKHNNILGKAINNPNKPGVTTVSRDDVIGSKRDPTVTGLLTKIAGNEQVQQAVVEKGIEVAGKLVDKQLQNIEEAQEKASDFLKKEIKLDITPEKGWATEDMFIPPGYHINAEIEGQEKPDDVSYDPQPYAYPAGMGSMIMNGCWGTGYKKGDPCFNALEASDQCRKMIDGAAFIGVGFDGRGQYSPESRKMSIIQRSCAGKSNYDNDDVPDTMNVHGIYDTTAHMTVFTSRSEYQKYLQKEAGVSGSVLGFYAGVKTAFGSSESAAKQTNLAIFDIDVDRYEIFQDEVKPQDLSRSFLREFIGLPLSYFAPGAPAKFQDFILRWGTHYIKSARFGGQLELRKTQLASETSSKETFAEESESEYKSLFWSAGSRSSTKSGESSKSQQKYMSTSIVVQGGSQKIATVISDMYSPTFKTAFTEWLESIPAYPKAFKFLMGSVTDLLNFRANDLFPEEKINWGCEAHGGTELKTDKESMKAYYVDSNYKRYYCEFASREEMDFGLKRRRVSLKRAIEVYMEEGAMSISDFSLPAGKAGCESNNPKYLSATKRPSWNEMTTQRKRFHVIFDMLTNLEGNAENGIDIPKSMSRSVQYSESQWYTADEDGQFHMYGGFSNGGSGNPENQKISIYGLVLTYKEGQASLVLDSKDYEESTKFFPGLSKLLKGKKLARAEWPVQDIFLESVTEKTKNQVGHLPCNIQWSNGLRFDPSDTNGKCLHFTASTKGTLYVVFSAVPSNKVTWYYVEISPLGVGIYKAQKLKVSTVNTNAVALGDAFLYQSYFVCVTESETSTVIEYGKSQGTTDSGDVYLTLIDNNQPIHARFYSFGNGEESAQIVDSHVVSRKLTTTECKGDTFRDKDEPNCVQKCNEACAPLAGCTSASDKPKASECNECRFARDRNGVCVNKCPANEKPNKDKYCTMLLSYDLSFKPETNAKQSRLSGFPTMNELTLCFWVKFEDIKPYFRYSLLDYINIGDRNKFSIDIEGAEEEGRVSVAFLVSTTSGAEGPNKVFDNKDMDSWHHYCVTRDSNSGRTIVYGDGINTRDSPSLEFLQPRKFPRAGGTMHLGGFEKTNFKGMISDLNIWDRILTEDEIEKMAKSCDGSNRGNVKDWGDIKNDLTPMISHYNVTTPSTCKAKKQVEGG